MKGKKIIILVSLILIGISSRLFGQFSLDGEFRPRFEFRDGYKQLPYDKSTPGYLVSQRSRLIVNYLNDKIITKITFQDIRLWGDEKLKTDVPSSALHEAWVQIKLSDSLSLKLGRQEISYDNDRLFSRNTWTQQGTSHDAAVLKYHYNGWFIDFGSAFNQVKDTVFSTDYSVATIKDNYKSLNYLWVNKKIKKFNLSLLGVLDGFQKENSSNTMYMRGTFGCILNYKYKDFNITGRGFMQTGTTAKGNEINKDYAGKKMDINAYYANMDISYLFFKKLTLLLGFEYMSGQDNKDLKKYTAFNTLYGTGHKFNGNMDYFTSFPKDMKNAGLFNPYLNFIYKLNDKTTLRADFHYFGLNNNYYYSSGVQKRSSAKYLGTEADISCNIDFSKEVSLLFGYSYMLADNAMINIVKGDRKRLGNWAFAMLTIKPTFFKTGK